MRFAIRPLTHDDVVLMRGWHYEPPFDEYDPATDPTEVAELEAAVGSSLGLAIDDADHVRLAGFAVCTPGEEGMEIGLGLRPDLTGGGLGAAFVSAIVRSLIERWRPRGVWLDVLPWNARAITVYERAGFVRGEVYLRRFEDGNEREFLRMSLSSGSLSQADARG